MGRTGAIAFLAVLAALLLSPLLDAPPVYDDAWVLRNPRASDPERALAAFLDPGPRVQDSVRMPAYAYRPLHELSFALQAGRPLRELHALQLLLHLACALLAARIARQLGAPPVWAAAALLLHPAAVQAAGYLSQRALVLQVLLLLASVTFYLDGRSLAAWIAGLLSMTAKESALALPLVLLGLDLVRDGRARWRAWLPFALLPLLPAAQMLGALSGGEVSHEPRPAWPDHLAGQGPVLARYLGLLALPFPMRFAFDRPPTALPALPCWLLVGALLLWILRGPPGLKPARAGLALVLLPLATEVLLPVHDPAWTYRLYASLAGAGILIGLTLGRRPVLAASALLFLAAGAAAEVRLWTAPGALLRRDVRSAPRRPAAWGDYAWRFLSQRRAEPALRLARRAPPGHPKADTALACALLGLGRAEEGRRALEAAARRHPDSPAVQELARALDPAPGAR